MFNEAVFLSSFETVHLDLLIPAKSTGISVFIDIFYLDSQAEKKFPGPETGSPATDPAWVVVCSVCQR